MAEVRLVPELEGDLETLPASSAHAVLRALTQLAQDPTAGRPLAIGDGALWELRVDDTRVVYQLAGSIVRVLTVRQVASSTKTKGTTSHAWDVFLSYSQIDSADFARSLGESLSRLGFKVWFDQDHLQPGMSLRRNIDEALNGSAHAVVILSPAFLKQAWAAHELHALAVREAQGERVILPIWYGVTVEDVVRFAPPLADRLALQADRITPEEAAASIAQAINTARSVPPDD
jgi:mRNA-degrading endonuclease RelE of RelBE toxin-antitoxin system